MSEHTTYDYPSTTPRSLELDPIMREVSEGTGIARLQLPYGEPCWVVTGYHDARSVYSSKSFDRVGMVQESAPRMTTGILVQGAIGSMNERDHVKLRRAILRELDEPRMSALERRASAIMSELLGRMSNDGGGDYVSQVAVPFSLRVLCELMGLPDSDAGMIMRWVQALFTDPSSDDSDPMQALTEIGQYVMALIRNRLDAPGDDFVSAMLGRGDLNKKEIAIAVVSLIFGGFESSATMLSKMVLALLTRPELRSELLTDPGRIPGAVEELLRTISVAGGEGIPWAVREPITLAGVDMVPGEFVMPAIGAANLDPTVFENPEKISFDRAAKSHLAFGHGTHMCLGYQIARMEMCIGLRSLLQLYP
ncbi:cytochrome P450, partial [Nocardia tengchongensis]